MHLLFVDSPNSSQERFVEDIVEIPFDKNTHSFTGREEVQEGSLPWQGF